MNNNLVSKDLLEMRQKIIKASFAAKEGHIPSAFSILEILYTLKLYNKTFADNSDVILSKGHASLAYYVILEKIGVITFEELMNFCTLNSKLGGHPDSIKLPEVVASTGSLGHGLPIAIGISYAAKLLNSKKNVFCILGDGEFNEGTTWEGALLAKQLNIKKLVCILDNNQTTKNVINLNNVKNIFDSLGWNTAEVDGHNVIQIDEVTRNIADSGPALIIANTVKGKGSKILENNKKWHHKHPEDEAELKELLNSLETIDF